MSNSRTEPHRSTARSVLDAAPRLGGVAHSVAEALLTKTSSPASTFRPDAQRQKGQFLAFVSVPSPPAAARPAVVSSSRITRLHSFSQSVTISSTTSTLPLSPFQSHLSRQLSIVFPAAASSSTRIRKPAKAQLPGFPSLSHTTTPPR